MKKMMWFAGGAVFGVTAISISMASVPKRGKITDDTAIYQNLSEIRVAREADLDFDRDITRLSSLEGGYKEKLPLARHPRLRAPMKRVSGKEYQYTGARKRPAAKNPIRN